MGNALSTRWRGHTKKTTVEVCERITAREAKHIGAPTLCEPVANSAARRLWCLCPDCERRARYLYRLPSGGAWKCRMCHRLTDRKTQIRGTRAAFEDWLTPERWKKMSQKHPASAAFEDAVGAYLVESVAPYDWEKLNQKQRAQLLEIYASEDAVKSIFAQQRCKWGRKIEELSKAASAEIYADIWKWWKHRTRRPNQPKI